MVQFNRLPIQFLVCLLCLNGCSSVSYMNPAFKGKLALDAQDPAAYEIKIDSEGIPIEIPQDGHLEISIPEKKGCTSYFLGIRLSGPRAQNKKSILIIRNEKIVKKMSIAQLRKLPVDASGYRVIRIK